VEAPIQSAMPSGPTGGTASDLARGPTFLRGRGFRSGETAVAAKRFDRRERRGKFDPFARPRRPVSLLRLPPRPFPRCLPAALAAVALACLPGMKALLACFEQATPHARPAKLHVLQFLPDSQQHPRNPGYGRGTCGLPGGRWQICWRRISKMAVSRFRGKARSRSRTPLNT
jgi:hypothetical protein